jgi:hypothetical protein
LPSSWREENTRKRTELARIEYPTLPQSERIPRLLSDLWPRYWEITRPLTLTVWRVHGLQSLESEERIESATLLDRDLRTLDEKLQKMLDSPEVKEIMQTTSSHKQSSHDGCCPRLPYLPLFLLHPEAGHFALIILCMKLYLRAIAFPALWDIIPKDSVPVKPLNGLTADALSVVMCCYFAGLETSFSDTPEALLPTFAALVLAALTCPQGLRSWLWFKFAHFEKMGGLAFDPIKKTCAVVWKIPEIATNGFDSSKQNIPPEFYEDISFSFMALSDAMAAAKLNCEDEG